MKALVLAEKPSVAREIARVLGCKEARKNYIEGEKYVVTWALGHLVELKMPEHYDRKYKNWRLEDLPIIPEKMETKIIRKTSQQFQAIRNLARRHDIKEVIIATDAGREGELVARWILEKIAWKKPVKRLWISSVTDKAIREGFKHLRPGKQFENLYHSAVCRAEADWLIGLNVSRALTTKYQDPLSAGRVQTPTLALIINREKQIQSFVPQPYWMVQIDFGKFSAYWEKNGERRIFSRDQAQSLTEQVKQKKAIIRDIIRKEKKEQQPLPYDLNELQREANKRYGFSAKKTLNIVQRLYEEHKLVTYPRTDSRYLTTDMEATLRERLQGILPAYEKEVRPLLQGKKNVLARRVFNNQKVTDHHAIIPTEERLTLNKLTADERKIYDLIVRRFLTLFYPPCRYENIQIVFEINGEPFVTRETLIRDPGFKVITDSTEHGVPPVFTNLTTGQTLTVHQVHLEEQLTEPPARYSEADLLGLMEKYGLGTPATRAEIIEKIVSSEVVERKHGRFFSTPKGRQLIQLVNEELRSPELTARWEKELELIARGKADPQVFLQKIRQQTRKYVQEIKASDKTYKAANLTGTKCPECGSYLKERNTKEGRILVCANFSCSYRRRKDPLLSNRRCPQCRQRMEIHDGKAGKYYQCRSCNIIEKSEAKQKTVNKREERKLIQKYQKKDEPFGLNLGELLKAALEREKNK